MDYFNFLGGRFTTLNMILLIFWLFIPIFILQNKAIRFIYTFIVYIIISLQLISLIITGKFIGYEFIVHTNIYDIVSMIRFYPGVIAHFIIYTILIISTIINRKIIFDVIQSVFTILSFNSKNLKISISFIFIIFSLKVFSMENAFNKKGLILKTIETISFFKTDNNHSFNQSLNSLGMDNYIKNEQLIASGNNKDILIISLESFESGLLSGNNSRLTPFMNKLKNEWYYHRFNQNIGSNWTSGSLYTMFTGLPAFFATKHNSIFQTAYKKEIVGLPDVLKKIGYSLTYITKDAKFSGTRSLLGCFGFDKIIDGYELGNGFDKDIFDRIKVEILANKNKGKKFSIFASTLDTHGPNGIIDKRFKDQFEEIENLDYSVSVLDYLIKDLYYFMKENSFLETTTIILLTDHLYMVKPTIIQNKHDRNLIYLSNSRNSINEKKISSLYQVHMPNMILSSCGISHNLKLFSNYYSSISDSLILENQEQITSLNLSGFKIAMLDYNIDSIGYNARKINPKLLIAHAGGEIDGNVYTNSLEALNKNYSDGFRLFELDISQTADGKYVAVHNWDEWQEICNYSKQIPPTHKTFKNVKIRGKYTPLDIDDINDWFDKHKDAILVTDKVNNPTQFSRLINFKNRLMMELFDLDSAYSARKLGIDVLLSENVIKERNLTSKRIKDIQIDKIAISHQYAINNDEKIIDFWEEGIIPYIYGSNDYFVGGNVLYNENFLTKNNTFQFQFGIYADKYPK